MEENEKSFLIASVTTKIEKEKKLLKEQKRASKKRSR